MVKRLFDEVNIIGPMKILKMNQLELTLSVKKYGRHPARNIKKNCRFD